MPVSGYYTLLVNLVGVIYNKKKIGRYKSIPVLSLI